MKKLIFVLGFISLTIIGSCQNNDDHRFKVPAYFDAGFYLNGKLYTDIQQTVNSNWDAIIGKPSVFTPAPHTHVMADITDLKEGSLMDLLNELGYTPLVQKTTAEINSIVPPSGIAVIVWDKTLGVLKVGADGKWKTFITGN